MDNSQDFSSIWKNQPVPEKKITAAEFAKMANSRIQYSASKHKATTVILLVVLVIIMFFAASSNYSGLLFFCGIGLMLTALLLRVIMEWHSLVLLIHVNAVSQTVNYLRQLESYFTKRKRIHKRYTLLSLSLYVAGFSLLLPVFYKALSWVFFLCIVVVFLALFFVLFYVIRKKVRKELNGFQEIISGLQQVMKSLSGAE